jgi:alpha-methylacyl-CoA racemase
MSGPLSGLRMIELVGLGPGPFAAMMLSDAGAEVIRVHPVSRSPTLSILNTRFDVMARGRRSLALDLKTEPGRKAFLTLVERTDALIEGFRPGVTERLGIGPDACHERNPALVYGRMTGWGQDGPRADTVGHDINYIGLTGALAAIGPSNGRPTVPLNLVGDFGGGGMMLAFGIMAAVHHAGATGKGQVVDAGIVDGTLSLTAMHWGMRAAGQLSEKREVNLLDGGAWFYGVYECADGGYVAVGAIEEKFRRAFVDILGLNVANDDGDDPRNWPGLRERVAKLFATRPRQQWLDLFEGTDACVSPVLSWEEVETDAHIRDRGALTEIDGVRQPAPAPRFSATPSLRPGGARPAGADSRAILSDWGLSNDVIRELFEAGVAVDSGET